MTLSLTLVVATVATPITTFADTPVIKSPSTEEPNITFLQPYVSNQLKGNAIVTQVEKDKNHAEFFTVNEIISRKAGEVRALNKEGDLIDGSTYVPAALFNLLYSNNDAFKLELK